MNRFPTRAEILEWIEAHPTKTTKRDIARAFGIKGAARIELKALMRELEADGLLQSRHTHHHAQASLPQIAVLRIEGPDEDGDLIARPVEWPDPATAPAVVLIAKSGEAAPGKGDRVLARITEDATDPDRPYSARVIRMIAGGPQRIIGIFRKGAEGGRILPLERGSDSQWAVPAGNDGGAKDGELVEGERAGPKGRLGLPKARIVARLGDPTAPKAVSLIAIHQHGIPDQFPAPVLAEAEAAATVPPGQRDDMTGLPFVTIDPADARDRDDAVMAEIDPDKGNAGGFILRVAIADVSHYVRSGSALDREARVRGNSTYFPDRVVPMLPDRLSGDICSLHEGVDRTVLVAEMRIDAQGHKIGHQFRRATIRSRASLAYEEFQAACDGRVSERLAPMMQIVVEPLVAAHKALTLAREARQPLDIELPERRIILDETGKVQSVGFKERLAAHRLIEDCMVLANVAAAETLIAQRTPLLFRVHEEPAPEKIAALREIAEASGFTLAKGQVLQTRHLNQLLSAAQGTAQDELINMQTLRSMTQAYYSPENFGHFGLALRNYAHFTSPIRRYADLIVHRALITAHRWGDDGLSPDDIDRLAETADQISNTERRSMAAERDTTDRYLASFLADRVGTEIGGRVSGVARFGLFVKLDETGADALVPVRTLGQEFFEFDEAAQTLTGTASGLVISVGQRVSVKLTEAAPVTGGLLAELLTVDERNLPKGGGRMRGRGGPARRKAGATKHREAAKAKKVKRARR